MNPEFNRRNQLLKPWVSGSTPARLWRHTGRMSNIDKQQINRWPGMNAWAFAVVVGLLMRFQSPTWREGSPSERPTISR